MLVKCILSHVGFSCPGGYVGDVESLFIVVLIVCGGFVFGPRLFCLMQYLVSFLVLQTSCRGRESLYFIYLSFYTQAIIYDHFLR